MKKTLIPDKFIACWFLYELPTDKKKMWCIKNTFSTFLKIGSISFWWSYFNIVPFHDYKFQENCFSFSFVELAVQTSCTHHIYTNVILSKVYHIHFSSLMRISKQVAHEAGKKCSFSIFILCLSTAHQSADCWLIFKYISHSFTWQ